jgi:electron transport complex protein RnfC
MLITGIKKKEELLPEIKGNTLIIACLGCKEVYFPSKECDILKKELKASGVKVKDELIFDYMCRRDFTEKRIDLYKDEIQNAETILVFSCGAGVQMFADLIENKNIVAGSDTFYLPGFQGVTPVEFDCEQCGECRLGDTYGICPITACSKGLLNGPCGGAKNGKCEVDKQMDCGWQKIFEKKQKIDTGKTDTAETAGIRDYSK